MLPKHDCSRRGFVRLLAGALPLLSFSPMALQAAGRRESEPHFFLNFIISGGVDASYLFDARPLQMTDAGKLQNYLYKNSAAGIPVLNDPRPQLWTGTNGGTTLVTPLVQKLAPWRQHYSIINGVVMLANGLVGHGQNMYFLFNGQSGNGPSFVPIMGHAHGAPLDSVHIGGFEGDANEPPQNFSGSVVLSSGAGLALAQDLRQGPGLDLNSRSAKFIQERLAVHGAGSGLFSQGSRKLLNGLQRAPQLAEALKSVTDDPNLSGLQAALGVAFQYFTRGVTTCMTIMVDHDPDIDTHDSGSAQDQLNKYRVIVDELALIFDWLTKTPFDATSGRSLLDVTTVMISSEFSRTMRQQGSRIDATGTDHNPLTNTVLLAGKRIQGGLIVGGSDLEDVDADGHFLNVSKAHLNQDPGLFNIMGRPLDFERLGPRPGLPETFVLEDYLTFPSIVNTLFYLSGVKEESYFRAGPGSARTAPVLTKLLKNA
jgi:hypothetical protein